MLESNEVFDVGMDSTSRVVFDKDVHSQDRETKMKGNIRDARPFQAIRSGSEYRQTSIQKACPQVGASLEAFRRSCNLVHDLPDDKMYTERKRNNVCDIDRDDLASIKRCYGVKDLLYSCRAALLRKNTIVLTNLTTRTYSYGRDNGFHWAER